MRVLKWEELPDLSGEQIFRLEAFGDLNNEYQEYVKDATRKI